jgi:hypothetical protein
MTLIAPRIAVDRLARFGKPVIEGARVPVSVIVGAVAASHSWEEIARTQLITHLFSTTFRLYTRKYLCFL